MVKKYAIEIKWALIFLAISLLWMVIEKLAGWHGERIDLHPPMTMLFFIPTVLIYFFAIREKRNVDFGGVMAWQDGFISGLILTVISAVLNPLQQIITHQFLSPEYFPNAIEYSLKENPDMTQAEAEAFFTLGSYIMQGLIGTIVIGLVFSAIVSIFLKKKAD